MSKFALANIGCKLIRPLLRPSHLDYYQSYHLLSASLATLSKSEFILSQRIVIGEVIWQKVQMPCSKMGTFHLLYAFDDFFVNSLDLLASLLLPSPICNCTEVWGISEANQTRWVSITHLARDCNLPHFMFSINLNFCSLPHHMCIWLLCATL